MASPLPAPLSDAPAPGSPRAERLLAALHPVCSHDLPNQAVALQSLLQLFEWDEAAQLSVQGREYFERLKSVAAKTMAMTQHLKELVRLHRRSPFVEAFRCAEVLAEVRAELQQAASDRSWKWEGRWHVEKVAADRRLVQMGIVGLLRSTLSMDSGGETVVQMETRATDGGVAWVIQARHGGPAAGASDAALLERRLVLTMAHEYLAATNIELRIATPAGATPAGATEFTLTIPQRTIHG